MKMVYNKVDNLNNECGELQGIARNIVDNLNNKSGVWPVHRGQFKKMNPAYDKVDKYIVDYLNNENGVLQGWQEHRGQC